MWQGYIEGEFVYVAAPLSGTLTNLAVSRGLEVKTGQLLFELDREPEAAAAREAEQRLAQAKSRLENLMNGRRPTEIAALAAQVGTGAEKPVRAHECLGARHALPARRNGPGGQSGRIASAPWEPQGPFLRAADRAGFTPSRQRGDGALRRRPPRYAPR